MIIGTMTPPGISHCPAMASMEYNSKL